MDSTEYVELLAKEARLQEELNTVSNRLYDLQQAMLRHYERDTAPIVAEALLP